MNRSGAAAQLLRIGRAAGPRAEAGGIRFTALLLAAFLLPLGLAAPVLVAATVQGRDQRVQNFNVTLAGADTPDDEILLYHSTLDDLPNSRQFQVEYLTPLGPGAPLPPGIDAWPEPGQVYLSPNLADVGADYGIARRYGHVVGTIDPSVLVDPDQLYAYVGPARPLTRDQTETLNLTEITAFGADTGYTVNWVLLTQDFGDLWGFVVFAVFLLAVPACLLAFAASRVAAHARDRREALIRVLGGRARHTLLVSLGETWPPVALGTAAAIAALGAALAADLPLPHVDFVLSAADARAAWPLLAACLAASALALCSMALLVPTGRLQGREPARAAKRPRLMLALAWLFPVFLLVASVGPRLTSPGTPVYYLCNYVGQTGVIVTVTPAIALACAAMAKRLHRLRWTRTRPAALTATARLAAHPRAVARQLAAVVAAFFILFFAFAYHSAWTDWVDEDRARTATIGGSIADVTPRGANDAADIAAFLAELPADLAVLGWSTHYDEDLNATTTFSGPCETLTALQLPCPHGAPAPLDGAPADERLAYLVERGDFGETDVLVAAVSAADFVAAGTGDEQGKFLIIGAEGTRVPEAAIMAAGTVFQLGLDASIPGSSLPGSNPSEQQARWITGFGTIALAILALSSVLSASGEFLRHGRALAPVGVLTGGLKTFRATSAITVFLPLVLGTTVGMAGGLAASSTLMKPGSTLLKAEYLVPTAGALLLVSAVMWFWASTVAIREAAKWTPGRGD